MNNLTRFCWLLLSLLPVSAHALLGTNLSWVDSHESQLVFVDAFKRSLPWIANNFPPDGSWNSGVDIPMDENGYPLSLPWQPPAGGPAQTVAEVSPRISLIYQ